MHPVKNCRHCNNEFTPTAIQEVFCCPECRRRNYTTGKNLNWTLPRAHKRINRNFNSYAIKGE